ncbi:unnamed protein product [Cyberlindnera jadinii]|uniref:Uncharacterized protein n=1 Tax=Cyberlindnera jadinii (strain ATCC 18201 / CBS 1600 / BCRC 20928 / JCM 3617 / NBRC 0987 / NRRL Y-1542) TaxID=983966 RepID=A0A0H5CGH4_CYBJN|nr:unnamed protein product [Cyberlindnera jadinii]
MADAGRKDFSDKIAEGITPDSQKSYAQQAKEGVTDGLDKAARTLQPDNTKSTTQQLGDSVSSGAEKGENAAQGSGKSLEQTASEYLDSAKKAVNDAVEYVSASVGGASEGAKDGAAATKK